MGIKVNLVIDQGATFSTSFNLTDDDDYTYDLSSYTATAKLRRHYESANSVSFTTEIEDNVVTLSLTPTETANINSGRYVYDIELFDNDTNNVIRIIEGLVFVQPNVTK